MPSPPRRDQRPPAPGRFFIASLAALLALAACAREEPAAGEGPDAAVVEGMSKEDVVARWGQPNVKVRQGGGERWSYWLRDERQRVVGKTYVLFDTEERVTEVVGPPVPAAPREAPGVPSKDPVTIT